MQFHDTFATSIMDVKRKKKTFDVCVKIFSTIESMHLLMIPRFSDHSGNLIVV